MRFIYFLNILKRVALREGVTVLGLRLEYCLGKSWLGLLRSILSKGEENGTSLICVKAAHICFIYEALSQLVLFLTLFESRVHERITHAVIYWHVFLVRCGKGCLDSWFHVGLKLTFCFWVSLHNLLIRLDHSSIILEEHILTFRLTEWNLLKARFLLDLSIDLDSGLDSLLHSILELDLILDHVRKILRTLVLSMAFAESVSW